MIAPSWIHVCCVACGGQHPWRSPVIKFDVGSGTTCCFCGQETASGCYVTEDPQTAPCRGKNHGEED